MVSDGEKSMSSGKLNKAFALCALLIASTGLTREAAAVSIYTGPDLPVSYSWNQPEFAFFSNAQTITSNAGSTGVLQAPTTGSYVRLNQPTSWPGALPTGPVLWTTGTVPSVTFTFSNPVLQALVYVQDGFVSEDYMAFITGKKTDGTSFGTFTVNSVNCLSPITGCAVAIGLQDVIADIKEITFGVVNRSDFGVSGIYAEASAPSPVPGPSAGSGFGGALVGAALLYWVVRRRSPHMA
jgi:hypothetical protein